MARRGVDVVLRAGAGGVLAARHVLEVGPLRALQTNDLQYRIRCRAYL